MSDVAFVLDLPEPPAQRGRKGWRSRWRKQHDAKEATWIEAIHQLRPFRDPPERVRVHAYYRLHSRRGTEALYADLKPILDALKGTHHHRDRLEWKNGIYLNRAYFVDDDEIEFGEVDQEIDREDRGVTLRVEVLDEEWEAPDRVR